MNRDGNTGCGEGQVNELVLFNVADWTTEEIARLCRDAVGSSAVEGAVDVINTAVPIGKRRFSYSYQRFSDIQRMQFIFMVLFSTLQMNVSYPKLIPE